jgi:hypothetical protein
MRIGNILQITFFIGFLITGSILMVFVHRTTASSETENRALASFPAYSLQSVISGAYFRELESYAADHIGFRDSLIRSSKYITSMQGVAGRESAVILPTNANNSAEAQAAPPEHRTADAGLPEQPTEQSLVTQQAEKPIKPLLSEEKGKLQGKVLVLEDRAMNLFTYDEASGQAYADAINHIQERLIRDISQPVRSSVLLAPTAVEFVQSTKLRSLSNSQKEAIDEVYRKIRTDVAKIDALSAMSGHADEPLFFRTDHHWTANGAFYAYAAYIGTTSMEPMPITAYEKGEVPGFLGSLHSSTMNHKLAAHPDTIVYYKPNVTHRYTVYYSGPLDMPLIDLSHAAKKNKYRIFLSGDRPWARITSQIDNNRKLLIIKDSYGNALVPFLLPHYSEIFVVDPRQFNQPLVPFVQKHHIQEILYVNNAGVLTDQGFAEQLHKLIR